MTGLIQVENQGLSKYATEEALSSLAKSGGFLPYVQLMSSSSNLVKSGKFPMAHWAMHRGKDDVVDLGAEFNLIALSWRPKAMDLNGDVRSFYDPKSEEFLRIKEQSGVKDSSCLCGVEFLIWIPDQNSFATYYAANFGGKAETENIASNLNKGLTFRVRYVDRKTNPYHTPVVVMCATEITVLPTNEVATKELTTFNNPKDSEVVATTEADAAATSRVR